MNSWPINFQLAAGYNFRNLAASVPAAEPLVHLTNRIYSKISLKLEEWHRYYSIWVRICLEFLAKKEFSISKKKKWLFILLTAVLFLPASYFIYLTEQGNFHAITPGEAYRSAQLDHDELKHYIRKYHIKSIINLRGKRTGCSWYREELEISKQYGVRHYDLSIPADKSDDFEDALEKLAVGEVYPWLLRYRLVIVPANVILLVIFGGMFYTLRKRPV